MAKLSILEYPDPRLRTRAEPVAAVDDSIRALIDDMLETMYAAPGVGLAATQVNVHKRVLVADVTREQNAPRAFVNPEIIERYGTVEAEEGCLSVPGIFDKLSLRSERVVVRALDRDGKPFELEADGLLAVCIQHEIDHLEGKLFVDYLSDLKRGRIRKKLEKERRERAGAQAPRERSKVPVI
jgi:peptide deformylase